MPRRIVHGVMSALTVFAAQYLIFLILLALAVGLWGKDKEGRHVITACLAVVLAVILVQVASGAYFDARPFTRGAPALIPHVADNGFPSDHTVIAATAAFLVLEVSRRAGIVLLVLAVAVGVARIRAGLHWPIDVVASIVIAAVAVTIASGTERLLHRLVWPTSSH